MVRNPIQSTIFLACFLMLFLITACGIRKNIHQASDAMADPQGVVSTSIKTDDGIITVVSTSIKTDDGIITQEKDNAGPVKTGSDNNRQKGLCVFGCLDTMRTEKKHKNRTASVNSRRTILTTPNSLGTDSQAPGFSSDYILGPEDIIDVNVWKNENLSKTVFIRPDGKISLPLIGDIQAAGETASQLRDSIKEKLKAYQEMPVVSVIVKEINSFVVFVAGEVVHPGKFLLRSDTSFLQAITMAGGFTQYAATNKIVLLRRLSGVETKKIIRYKDIVSGKKPEDDVLLQRGDTIVVP